MMNKKGVSQVVTTLIILLVVIVVVGIVAAVIYSLVGQGEEQLEGGLDCFSVIMDVESASYAATSGYSIGISRAADSNSENIDGVKIIFSDGTTSTTVTGTQITGTQTLGPLGSSTLTVTEGNAAVDELKQVSVEVAAIVDGQTCNPTGKKSVTGTPTG